MSKIIKSPLNYHGGKTKILSQIYPLLPSNINNFVDLFAGGFNVGINIKANKIYCNDIQKEIIELYELFKYNNKLDILNDINKRINEFCLSKTNEDGYYVFRDEYNRNPNPLDFFVLICHSFNNQINFSNKGEFNVSFGMNRTFNSSIKNNLITFIDKIKIMNIKFSSLDFRSFDFSVLNKDDFVYADPPYLISNAKYNKLWSKVEEYELLNILNELNNKGVKFALSNVLEHKGMSNDILKKWIKTMGYQINYIKADYSNCVYNKNEDTKNMKTEEVLITNYRPEVLEML